MEGNTTTHEDNNKEIIKDKCSCEECNCHEPEVCCSSKK